MKKVTTKKLSLGKIKVASLDATSQLQVKGGAGTPISYSCKQSCIPYSEWRTCWCD
ncbi:class I lanthipeptide [Chitinophaga solisilvae]|uniref:class I lanthipeptide n=1 Tax=Chitinophaga solisilvae TaxID=1233460 RepID=UPI0019243F4A